MIPSEARVGTLTPATDNCGWPWPGRPTSPASSAVRAWPGRRGTSRRPAGPGGGAAVRAAPPPPGHPDAARVHGADGGWRSRPGRAATGRRKPAGPQLLKALRRLSRWGMGLLQARDAWVRSEGMVVAMLSSRGVERTAPTRRARQPGERAGGTAWCEFPAVNTTA